MSRGFDHIVHAVRDLDVAGDFYQRLGFIVGTRNRHPQAWGTQNRIVQLSGVFVELLALADTTHIAPHAPHVFSFGAFTRDFLAREQGLSMLALEGRGAPDAEAFRAAGIGDFELYDFEREGKRADGMAIKLAFSLAFAADPRAPDVGFFTCLHHHPDNFWDSKLQDHANTAKAVAGVVLVAENPADHHVFLSAFTGERDLVSTSAGVAVKTPRGEIQVMDPAAFTSHFGVTPPDITRGPRFAAVRFATRNLGAAAAILQKSQVAASMRMGRIVIGPTQALGATLVSEQA
jgi:hypothetical protein